MKRSVGTRALTANEAALLRKIVRALPEPDADVLDTQVGAAQVTGGIPTLLDLSVDLSLKPALVEDGPLPVRTLVSQPRGEILVWVKSGYLDGLEFAWTSDDAPTEMPELHATTLES